MDSAEGDPEQVGRGLEVLGAMAGTQRPVVADTGRGPGIGPLAGVEAEVDPGRGVADLQQRSRTTWPSEAMKVKVPSASCPMPNVVTGPCRTSNSTLTPQPRLPW